LRDRNGVEIYEGDIVAGWIYEYDGRWQVIFDDGAFSLEIAPDYCPCLSEGVPGKQLKVIGNKFENPELLE